MKYGNAPKDLGFIDLNPTEMMFYLYLPIKIPGQTLALPPRLNFLDPLLDVVICDNLRRWRNIHIYVTAKTLYVAPGMAGNRPGLHVDGYGSNGDINYVWSDMNPTEFAVQEFVDIPDDDFLSMRAFEHQFEPWNAVTYPDKHLLRLDETVVHRVNPVVRSGVRTFIKISVSEHKYNLKGNSHNYLLDYDWEMHDRIEVRNVDNRDYVK